MFSCFGQLHITTNLCTPMIAPETNWVILTSPGLPVLIAHQLLIIAPGYLKQNLLTPPVNLSSLSNREEKQRRGGVNSPADSDNHPAT